MAKIRPPLSGYRHRNLTLVKMTRSSFDCWMINGPHASVAHFFASIIVARLVGREGPADDLRGSETSALGDPA